MADISSRYRKCSECSENCCCGCQNNIYSLPLEILENILQYQDPISLISLEKTCKIFSTVVSNFWFTYCKRKKLLGKPTILCLGWDVEKNASNYSYDKAVQLSTDDEQKWRIMAVRHFLRRNHQCVVCEANCEEIDDDERFTFGDDILLCSRCLPYFTITVTHDMFHLFDAVGINTKKLHVAFGTILISRFIRALRLNNENEAEIMKKLRLQMADSLASTFASRMSSLLDLMILPESANRQGSQRDISLMLSRQQRCCCSVKQCAAGRTQTERNQGSVVERDKTRERPFCIALWVLQIINFGELIFASVLAQNHEVINIARDQTAPFLMLAYVEMVLLFCCTCYCVINWYRRIHKRGWNQSFSMILQCFLLASILVEVISIVVTKSYIKELDSSFTKFFEKEIQIYSETDVLSNKIGWIQGKFKCCGYSKNITRDWLNSNQLPSSCCSSFVITCVPSQSFHNCLSAVTSSFVPMLNSFAWTTLVCTIFHTLFMIYIRCMFSHFRSARGEALNSQSVQTIFTIS